MYRVKITSVAGTHLDAILLYLNTNFGVQKRAEVLDYFSEKLKELAMWPEMGVVYFSSESPEGKLRKLIVKKLVLIYDVSEEEQLVRILAIYDQRQNYSSKNEID